EDDVLEAILKSDGTPEKWVDRLVGEANRRGGLDNITVIIVRVDSVEEPAEGAAAGAAAAQA
ncbi:MAG TPA: hypothetical protein VMT77_05885, partial [Gemmatimonadales bacterium]|nr:hypothetical protein [Gemmatimonadales bacterium]